MLRLVLRRVLGALAVLLVISYLAFLAQDLSLHSRMHQAAPAPEVLRQAAEQTFDLWRNLLRGDLGAVVVARGVWRQRTPQQFGELLGPYFVRSLALLTLSMALGGLVGGSVGLLAAGWRRRGVTFGLLILSIIGISTPSFFLGTLLRGSRSPSTAPPARLPVGGFTGAATWCCRCWCWPRARWRR